MIPLTNKDIKTKIHEGCCRLCTWRNVAIFVALHGVISTLLLPLTLRGSIGGQYGMLISIGRSRPNNELLSVTDVPFAHEMFLISLLFLAHLIGFVSVIKKSMIGMVFYMLVHLPEFTFSFFWMRSVGEGTIKSHVMSQYSLAWYCAVSCVTQYLSLSAIAGYAFFIVPKKIN
ncbi:uncharacterized protein LOC122855349 [Aphidius gifuensis]|uniref:uncharacterized protein LOC122855349 n=1 Tax=Aphidius gifuensis TaxID=684658 RepID=UPI001CDC2C3B|nr:uncharacterized protein LOC122855349 [Aphidius gifuensis]